MPSVVYVMFARRRSPRRRSPVMSIVIGTLFVQPAGHAAALQVSELVGAAASAWAVKLVPVLESPALFCAVT